MKRFFVILFVVLFALFSVQRPAQALLYNYSATTLTGGGAGALDAIDGAALADLDSATVYTLEATYVYSLDADSATAESSPGVISPDANAGNKRWHLTGIVLPNTGLHLLDSNGSHDLIIKSGSNITADRTVTLTTGDADRTLTLNEDFTIGDGTNITITGVTAARTLTLNENFTIDGTRDVTISAQDAAQTLTLDNCSLEVEDDVGSGNTIKFVIATDDADRTITLSGNPTLGDWFDQPLKVASTPTLAGLLLTGGLALAGNSITGTAVNLNNIKLQQLNLIGATTISAAQWGYLGGMGDWLDQSVKAAANVIHAQLQLTAQPAFLARPTGAQTDIAVGGGGVTVVWGTEIFDLGGDFAANTFTAPVTGKYQLDLCLLLTQVDTGATTYTVTLNTSNRVYQYIYDSALELSGDAAVTVAFGVLADMDATDTCTVSIEQTGGAQQTDIHANSWFSGHLVA